MHNVHSFFVTCSCFDKSIQVVDQIWSVIQYNPQYGVVVLEFIKTGPKENKMTVNLVFSAFSILMLSGYDLSSVKREVNVPCHKHNKIEKYWHGNDCKPPIV